MIVKCEKSHLSGKIVVPGSKSHTIRGLLLAAMSDGICHIKNPLPSADCLSAAHGIKAFGAKVDVGCPVDEFGNPLGTVADTWTVVGAGKNIHLPSKEIDVGNSGSTLYFFTPVAATFKGLSGFTGDESICKRPVNHLLDALKQVGAEAYTTRDGVDAPPFKVEGPIKSGKIITDGRLSQYISGFMMASALLEGTIHLELTDPKETPYLTMTKQWLESVGIPVEMSEDFKKIVVSGPHEIKAFDRTIPSDWEGVAFPVIAALLSGSDIVVEGVDLSGSQGDDEIVEVLQALGGDLYLETTDAKGKIGNLVVKGSKTAKLMVDSGKIQAAMEKRREKSGNCSFYEKDGKLHVNLSGWPDAVCALSVVASFVDGVVVLEDLGVCRRKETDRLKVMTSELKKLGVEIEELENSLIITGGGTKNNFGMKGTTVESYDDHRVAMSLACLGFALPESQVIVKDAECCSVSFPGFFEKMQNLGAKCKTT